MSGQAEDGELAQLRGENARIQSEVDRLLCLLRLSPAEAARPGPTQSGFFEAPPGVVHAGSPTADKVAFYGRLFAARRDVYAVRWDNPRLGRSGWKPAVRGPFRRDMAARDRDHLRLTPEVLAAHLSGDAEIGLYPLLDDNTCWWVAADFDGDTAMLDALAYLKAARRFDAPVGLEVSRSGVGAHAWLFFTSPIPAELARQVATGLLREAMAVRGRMTLASYDRLFPSQDALNVGGIGNQIAAPLHRPHRRRGTTVFLDPSTMEPHEDQWAFLSTLGRMTPREAANVARRIGKVQVGAAVRALHPASATRISVAPPATVNAEFGSQLTIKTAGLPPALLATLRHAATMPNPEFWSRVRRRASTWNVPRFVESFDETIDGNLALPRGLAERTATLIQEAGSRLVVTDNRVTGQPQTFAFAGMLRDEQQAAFDAATSHDQGVVVAPPGSGKTVIACAVIAHRAVPALILVDRVGLADQWKERIATYLGVQSGRLGGKKTTGVIDIATMQTLARRDNIADLTNGYGLVVVDECHHVPAAAYDHSIRHVPARYWLGLTATPYRRDQLDEIIEMQLGPVRHAITPPPAGTLQPIDTPTRPEPVLRVHKTAFFYTGDADPARPGGIAAIHTALAADPHRNQQLLDDITDALNRDRRCIVLTQRTAHVEHLADRLRAQGHDPVVLRGGMKPADRKTADARLRTDDGTRLVIATGPYVGEGFDCPALDTLFLAAPVSFRGRLVQYVGRVLRPHPGKTTAEVHDYHDLLTPVLASSLRKRAPGYRTLGFPDPHTLL